MGIGIVIAVAILVLVPLLAVVAARLWRDPPRERWALRARTRADGDPLLAEWKLRQRLGLSDDRRWRDVNRLVGRGEAAPPELRGATRELAEHLIADLDRRLAAWESRKANPVWVLAFAVSLAAAVYVVLHGLGLILVYQAFWVVRAIAGTPWWLRRRRRRAESALAANA